MSAKYDDIQLLWIQLTNEDKIRFLQEHCPELQDLMERRGPDDSGEDLNQGVMPASNQSEGSDRSFDLSIFDESDDESFNLSRSVHDLNLDESGPVDVSTPRRDPAEPRFTNRHF